jgi:hypothetical protein
MLENANMNEAEKPQLNIGAVSGSFMCALGKEKPCKEQCFTCSEDEMCDNENLSNKQQKVQTSTESVIDGNIVLAVRCFQIDFGNHIRCKIKVENNQITVEGAINGWGDGVPLDQVVIFELK